MICTFNVSASLVYVGNFITQYYLTCGKLRKNVKKPYKYLYINVEILIGLLGIKCILRSPTAASAVANGSRAALSGSGNATRSSAAAGAVANGR